MSGEISSAVIASFKTRLEQHPVYAAVQTQADLQCFMRHHVYSVWDFMSLIKYLQSVVAPTGFPWAPAGDASVQRFINELVLEEETDQSHIEGEFSSHYALYLRAMAEIGADTAVIQRFVGIAATAGIDAALAIPDVPVPSRGFVATTFAVLDSDRPHQVAAALALGREHIIPGMFRAILARIGVGDAQAPIFHFYLKRHIHLDEDFHAPLSLRLLNRLCAGDAKRIEEAIAAANRAVNARLTFWDGVLDAIEHNRSPG